MGKQSIKALVEVVDGKMLAVASDESQDRQGDRISQTDWDLRNFRKNPVLLLSHQYHLPPIGVAKKLKINDGKLTFEPEFHEITQQAKEIKQMFFDGIMKAFSVGFIPGKKKNELLEISAVSVPANANALVFEKGVSEEEEIEIKNWVEKEADDTDDKKEKSPACRMSGEDKKECVDRKIPELIDEGYKRDQAVAMANSMCEKDCNEKELKEEETEEEAEREIKAYIKDTNLQINKLEKGRQDQAKSVKIIAKALEKFNKQLGYIQRKIK